jgi:hypothetical protein
MSWSKEDISFKKLSNKRVTWTTNKVFEEIGARSLDIHNTDIKADTIPSIPPGTGVTGLLQYYDYLGGTGLTLVKDLTVSDSLTYFATIFNGSGNEAFANQLVGAGATGRLFNWVSDKYDQLGLSPSLGYEIKLYDKDGNQITKTDPSDWYFDYQTGILIFTSQYQSAATTIAKAPYYITGYRYIGGFGITAGSGGTGTGSVGTGYTTGIAYYTGLNDITSSDSFTWDSGSSLLTLNNSTFSLTGSTITSGDWAGNTIQTLYGGTGLTSYTKGDILVGLGGTLLTLPVGSNNYFLAADSSTDTGLNWVSGLATTGIISLNNLDSIAQTLEVGQAGVKFNIASTGTSHTFNIPNAGVGVSGLITGTTQSIGGVKSFYDNLLVRDGKELRLYSASNLYYSGLKSAATASTTFTLPNGTGTSGQILSTDGSGVLTWVDKGVYIGETPPISPYVGDLWYDSTDGTFYIYYYDGVDSYWVEVFAGTGGEPIPSSGTGISILNGLTGSEQTFSVGFTGNTFNIVSIGTSHTFNLPYASEFVSGIASTVTQNFKGLKSFFDGVNLYNQSELKLYNSDNSEYTGFKSTATDSVLYSLPATDGQGLQVLYTDGSAGLGWTYVGDVVTDVVPPASPRYGTLWWDTEEGNLYIYYFDGTNPQWVETSSGNGYGSGGGGVGLTYDYIGIGETTVALGSTVNLAAGGGMTITYSGDVITFTSSFTGVAMTNAAPVSPNSGDLWWHTEEGQLKVYYQDTDTNQWVDASSRFGAGTTASGFGITVINGLHDLNQSFAVGKAGTDFSISSIGGSHTFNLPLTGSGTTGLISPHSQTIYGAKTFNTDVNILANLYVDNESYVGGVPSYFTVGGSAGTIYFGIAKGQNINRFAGLKVEEIPSPLGGGNLNGEVVFYTDSESQDFSTERLRITGFGTVISSGPVVLTSTSGSANTSSGDLLVYGGIGVGGQLNASTVGVADLTQLVSSYLVTTTTANDQVLHSYDSNVYRTAKYTIQVISGFEVNAIEILLTTDGIDIFMTEYAQVLGPGNIAISTYDAQLSLAGNVELLVTPSNASTVYTCSGILIRG